MSGIHRHSHTMTCSLIFWGSKNNGWIWLPGIHFNFRNFKFCSTQTSTETLLRSQQPPPILPLPRWQASGLTATLLITPRPVHLFSCHARPPHLALPDLWRRRPFEVHAFLVSLPALGLPLLPPSPPQPPLEPPSAGAASGCRTGVRRKHQQQEIK